MEVLQLTVDFTCEATFQDVIEDSEGSLPSGPGAGQKPKQTIKHSKKILLILLYSPQHHHPSNRLKQHSFLYHKRL